MLTTRCLDCSTHGFLPHTSSPLSPRSVNIYGRFPAYMSPSPEADREQQKCAHTPTPFAKRPIKKAPSPKQDELKERRRGMFLKKVREGRDDKRFEARGEDIMRLEFVQRQRQWEAELARQAPVMPADSVEDEDGDVELPTSSNAMQMSSSASQRPLPDEEVDEVLQMEDEELAALMAYMPSGETPQEQNADDETQRSDHLWSDDDDYDALFSEVADPTHEGGEQQSTAQHDQDGGGEAMDLS